jgi:hypothetical protein
MVAMLPMEVALQVGHTVPMTLGVVCMSDLLVTDDSPQEGRVDGHDDKLIDVVAPLFHH